MQRTEAKMHLIEYKLAYTVMIVIVYLLGRNIPLYGIDVSAYKTVYGDADALLMQAIGGDANQYSLFALGLSPFMISSLLMMIIISCRNACTKVRMSPRSMSRIQFSLVLNISLFQALNHVQKLNFRATGRMLFAVKVAVVVEMMAGVMLVIWLAARNRRYGLGGQTILIYINIVDGVISTTNSRTLKSLLLPAGVSLIVLVVTLIMEGSEVRIPMQRISIHNIYADRNYMAIKLNPVGGMPVMFSSAFLALFRLIISGLHWVFPGNELVVWWQESLTLTNPVGIVTYIVILYLLTMGFAMVMISPSDISEQLLKSGDSIMNLHAGRDTRKYLRGKLCAVCFFSATVMSICLGVPMLLQLVGGIDRELVMFPASVMMLSGLWYNIYQEYITVKSYEAYQPFI